MTVLRDVVVAVALISGALFCLLGAVGLLRFPDPVCRLHASAKAQSVGVMLIMLGAAVRAPLQYAGALLLIAAFQLLTAPVTAQIISRIAYRTGAVDSSRLAADELGARLGRAGERYRRNGDGYPEPPDRGR
jgi:multicomponent Na+:H+ antiporter subunit G